MTVERLIELLREQFPLAPVFIEWHPCTGRVRVIARQEGQEGEPVAVYHSARTGRVYIQADGHDC